MNIIISVAAFAIIIFVIKTGISTYWAFQIRKIQLDTQLSDPDIEPLKRWECFTAGILLLPSTVKMGVKARKDKYET